LRDVRILRKFYTRTFVDSPAFLKSGLAEKIVVRLWFVPINLSAEEIGDLDGFLYEAAQHFEVFSNI
jgi:hypothetical protein